jgi:hypothetical protein
LAARDEKTKPLEGGIRFNAPNFAMRVSRDRFQVSYDRGRRWEGPFSLGGSFQFPLTSRTDYLAAGERECLVFLSGQQPEVRAGDHHDRAFCARTTDGGRTFEFLGWMTGEPLSVRSVMPSTVRIPPGLQLVSALRRRAGDNCWIDAYGSEDNGKSWKRLSKVADVGGDNGNPPSLVRLPDGRLCVAYASRSAPMGIRAKVSRDQGRTWGDEIVLRKDARTWDIGYPRTVVRKDGKLVTIYYYTTDAWPEQHIAATIWSPND